MSARPLGVALALALVGSAVALDACSTRDYALCVEHPTEDPARCADASAADGGAADGGACPKGMVFIPVGGGGYCIDAKETTVSEYAAFLASSPKASNTTVCGWKTKPFDFVPGGWTTAADDAGTSGQLAAGRENHPVVSVDWCDAYEYCASKGKHLCGEIGGGPTNGDGGAWFNACTHGDDGFFTYPWGNDAGAKKNCNGTARASSLSVQPDLVPVGSVPSCEGPYGGLFDMLGNAAEWIDQCTPGPQGVRSDLCVQRGGAFTDDEYLECAKPSAVSPRDLDGTKAPNVGIRCCR